MQQNKRPDGKKIAIVILLLASVLFLLLLDVTKSFFHGFFTDARPYENVGADSILGTYDLSNGAYSLEFTPGEEHFAGVVLYLENQPESNTGSLTLQVKDAGGTLVSSAEADLAEVKNEHAYKVQMKGKLRKGETYRLEIAAKDCGTVPSLILVDSAFRMEESIGDSLLIGYAYAKPDFSDSERLLITLFILGGMLIFVSLLDRGDRKEPGEQRIPARLKVEGRQLRDIRGNIPSVLRRGGILLILMTALAWNYSFNSLDVNNDSFEDFQADSERLVTQAIEAVQEGVPNPSGTGLIKLDTLQGTEGSETEYPTDDNWLEGYHRTDPAIRLRVSAYTEQYAVPGNFIRFADGETSQILAVVEDENEDWMTVVLDIDSPLEEERLGSLTGASILDADGNPVPEKVAEAYGSQYGLQGKVFQHLANVDLDLLRTWCALAAGAVLLLVACLVRKACDSLMGAVFYAVFLLSPWIVNFANNLYWVEFTWFLPMAAGLFCLWKLDRRGCRIFSYVLVFLTVMMKCLCGYEYITTVMLGTIAFPSVEFLTALANKDREKAKLLFRTIFLLGVSALLGFAAAICIHAPVKSGGSLTEGIRLIIQEDVLRRTYGADLNAFENLPDFEQYALTASAWETLCKYFHFKTEVITGVGGNLFPLLCLIPLVMLALDVRKNQLTVREAAGYVVFFVTSVSWFVLAKSHSCVHTHMNFVLWYFGFVQSCFYIILRHLIQWLRGQDPNRSDRAS